MYRRFTALAMCLLSACVVAITAGRASAQPIDRTFVIVMENQSFDEVIGTVDGNGVPNTPYITNLALRNGLATLYFGVTHPSLPNYLSMIAGDYLGVQDDNDSCYAIPSYTPGCHAFSNPNLVDLLVARHISWAAYMQSMPSTGFRGDRWPLTGPKLYAQKHNPFVYFKDIALNPAQLQRIKPLNSLSILSHDLASPMTAPRFVYIVPDQCHDMHGTTTCSATPSLLKQGDGYVRDLISRITASPSFTRNSVIYLTWDENDYSGNLGCCDSPAIGGGHVATIAVSPLITAPYRSQKMFNHYSLLATIENAYGLPHLGHSGDAPRVQPLDLLP